MKIFRDRIPKHFNYVAIDEDGSVNAFINKPSILKECGYNSIWVNSSCVDKVFHLTEGIEYEAAVIPDWEKSLRTRG